MFKPPFILSIAGGGSTYTPGIVKSLMVQLDKFPLAEIQIVGEQNQKDLSLSSVQSCVCAICSSLLMNLKVWS